MAEVRELKLTLVPVASETPWTCGKCLAAVREGYAYRDATGRTRQVRCDGCAALDVDLALAHRVSEEV